MLLHRWDGQVGGCDFVRPSGPLACRASSACGRCGDRRRMGAGRSGWHVAGRSSPARCSGLGGPRRRRSTPARRRRRRQHARTRRAGQRGGGGLRQRPGRHGRHRPVRGPTRTVPRRQPAAGGLPRTHGRRVRDPALRRRHPVGGRHGRPGRGAPHRRRTVRTNQGCGRASAGAGRRREILDVAERLFAEHGYASTSMDDVAEAVGVTKPAIYHYFRSKDDILLEIRQSIIDDALARVVEQAHRAHVERARDGVRGRARLLGVVADHQRGRGWTGRSGRDDAFARGRRGGWPRRDASTRAPRRAARARRDRCGRVSRRRSRR